MSFNMSIAMTATEHVDSLETNWPAIEFKVDQRLAVAGEVDAFMNRIAETVPWQALLPNFLPEVRNVLDGFMHDYRTVSASADVWCDLPYGAEIDPGDLRLETFDPRGAVGLPENVPVALYRHGNVFHRVYCWGTMTLDIVYDNLRNDSDSRQALLRNSLQRRLPDPGCDLHILPEAAHTLTNSRATGLWPIACGEHVVFLRFCTECIGALFQKYEIGQCKVETPWGIG